MVTTIHHHKAGTVEYVATARRIIPLADPEQFGNLGMQGCDEDYQRSAPFGDLAGAEAWMRWAFVNVEHAQAVEIDKVEWTEDVFSDDEYGRVYDACAETTWRWIYWLTDDGPKLDEEYDPR